MCRGAAVAFLKIIFQNFTGASGESYELPQPAQVALESEIEHGISNVKQMCYRLDCDLPSLFLSSFTDALQMSAVGWEGIFE